MADSLQSIAAWPITGTLDPDGTVSASFGGRTYIAAGEDTAGALRALARRLVEEGADLDSVLSVGPLSIRLHQAV